MWSQDIQGSEAYAKALLKTGIISEQETKEICEGLEKVGAEWAAGEFEVVVSTLMLCMLPLIEIGAAQTTVRSVFNGGGLLKMVTSFFRWVKSSIASGVFCRHTRVVVCKSKRAASVDLPL